jgi:hypothetical protein
MRHMLALAVLSAFALPLQAATPLETVAAFHQAMADGKAGQASALLAPEIQIYESGHVERSRSEYAGHHLPADIAFGKGTSSKVLKQTERIAGTLAVVMQESETSGKHQGASVHLFGTETAVLERRGEQWIITHLHWSARKAR